MFIEEKRDEFFLRSTVIIIFLYRLDAKKKLTLDIERSIEDAYTTNGFSSWKKTPRCFEEHHIHIVIKVQLRIVLLFQSAKM